MHGGEVRTQTADHTGPRAPRGRGSQHPDDAPLCHETVDALVLSFTRVARARWPCTAAARRAREAPPWHFPFAEVVARRRCAARCSDRARHTSTAIDGRGALLRRQLRELINARNPWSRARASAGGRGGRGRTARFVEPPAPARGRTSRRGFPAPAAADLRRGRRPHPAHAPDTCGRHALSAASRFGC